MTSRQSPLHSEHLRLKGRMVDFHGWQLPVQYEGLVAEHRAVRTAAGLFDVSHMGEIAVRGSQARDALNHLLTNGIRRLVDGQAQYNLMLLPGGGIVDDLVVYRLAEDDWLLVVNAANRAKDVAWVSEQIGDRAEVEDISDSIAQLALQGPRAQEILARLTDLDLPAIKFYRFAKGTVAGVEGVLVSRTGYTGEDGFELYLPPDSAPGVWRAIFEVGAPLGLKPAGLGARDSLRLEAKFALYGNDIDETTNPIEAGLRWVVKMKKGDFIGREALRQVIKGGRKRRLVGLEVTGRGIARPGYSVEHEGEQVGRVTSGTHSPSLDRPIAVAYVAEGLHEVGTELQVRVRTRAVAAKVVPTPFYKRPDA